MTNTMRILHQVELIAILFLLIISAVEGFYIVKIALQKPTTALIVVEDTKELTELPPIPEAQITTK